LYLIYTVYIFFFSLSHTIFFSHQTTITVEFKPLPSVTDYELQWKEYPQKWDNTSAGSKKLQVNKSKKKFKVEATDLNPGMTYCVRMTCPETDPGPELIIDTEQVGCTPKSSCAIL
jgi:hypothetical protein